MAPNHLRWLGPQGIEVTMERGTDILPPEMFEGAWQMLSQLGIMTADQLPGVSLFRSAAITAIFSLLPYVEYTAYPKVTLFLMDHTFTSDELSKTFGVGIQGGIRWSGDSARPRLVVFITNSSGASDQNHPYHDRWDGDILRYTGEGLEGDQAMSRGNLALNANISSDFPVYGFEKRSGGKYAYLGRFKVENVTQEQQPDAKGQLRDVFVFQMRLIHSDVDLSITEQAPLLDLSAAQADFSSRLRKSHVVFGQRHEDIVRSFVASLATKRLVILTGLSGSGKTQIALRFGDWLGRGQLMVVPVRPDWTGSEALFGFEDALQPAIDGRRAWHVPDALEFMLRAAGDPGNPYLLVLDEMNLAHVERYFADVLSGMESGHPCLPNLAKGSDGRWRVLPGAEAKIPFPKNLFIVGTVNVDETTYMFSPKVLDRANTIEFRVDTGDLSTDFRRPVPGEPGSPALVRGFLAIAADDGWHQQHPASGLETFTGHLRRLHALLSEGGFEYGHRVFYEAVRFAAMLEAAGDSDPEHALDLQVMQKVLPRLHGTRRRLEATLCALGQFCFDLSFEPGAAADGAASRFDPLTRRTGEARLPRSFDKVRRMTRSLRANQFVSFTE